MMKKKIALIFGQYNHPVQPYLATWAESLSRDTLEVQIFDFNRLNKKKVFSLGAVGRFEQINNLIKYFFHWPLCFMRWMFRSKTLSLKKKLKLWSEYAPLIAFQADAIHLVNSYLFPKLFELISYLKVPLLVSFRGYDLVVRPWVDEEWKRTLPRLFDQAATLHFVSQYLCDEAIQLGAPREKCRVIYPSIDLSQFSNTDSINITNTNSGNIKIVSTGRLVWQKNFSRALQVIKQLVDRDIDVSYVIIGEGVERDHLTYMIRALSLEKYVQLKGQSPQSAVRSELQAADIYFHPSETEAIPVAIMEAAAMGKAIVASNAGGVPEAVQDRVTGWLVSPYDVDAMTEAVFSLVSDATLRERLGNAAQKFTQEHFSLETETKEWEDLYHSLGR